MVGRTNTIGGFSYFTRLDMKYSISDARSKVVLLQLYPRGKNGKLKDTIECICT